MVGGKPLVEGEGENTNRRFVEGRGWSLECRGGTCRGATGATCVFEDGQTCESQLVVHTDDELSVGEPELERDVFAGGLRLNERLARGQPCRFFERFESLQRREIVHGDKSFVEKIGKIFGPHQKPRERVEEIGIRSFRWRKRKAVGVELRSELLEETSQKRPANAFEDARLIEAFEFESCHGSLNR